MRQLLSRVMDWLRRIDPNQRNYWMGLLMLFVGLTFFGSIPLALIVVGASMAVESVITSYLAGVLKSRMERDSQ